MPIPETNSDEQVQTLTGSDLFDDEPAPTAPIAPVAETTPDQPKKVRMGPVKGDLHRMETRLAQMLTGSFGARIEALQGSPSVANLRSRVRETEGRCAPIIFTAAKGDRVPRLFAGLETLAAAIALGLTHVHVITIASGDAGALQSFLAYQKRGGPGSPTGDLFEEID
jgi:hypothetical protein